MMMPPHCVWPGGIEPVEGLLSARPLEAFGAEPQDNKVPPDSRGGGPGKEERDVALADKIIDRVRVEDRC